MNKQHKKQCCFSKTNEENTLDQRTQTQTSSKFDFKPNSCFSLDLQRFYSECKLTTPSNGEYSDTCVWKGELWNDIIPVNHEYSNLASLYVFKIRERINTMKNRQICLNHFDLMVRCKDFVLGLVNSSGLRSHQLSLEYEAKLLDIFFAEGIDTLFINEIIFEILFENYKKTSQKDINFPDNIFLSNLLQKSKMSLYLKNKAIKEEDFKLHAHNLFSWLVNNTGKDLRQIPVMDLKLISILSLYYPESMMNSINFKKYFEAISNPEILVHIDKKDIDNQNKIYYWLSVLNIYLHNVESKNSIEVIMRISENCIDALAIESQQILVITVMQQMSSYTDYQGQFNEIIKRKSHVLMNKEKFLKRDSEI
jgi:hypothetical protein